MGDGFPSNEEAQESEPPFLQPFEVVVCLIERERPVDETQRFGRVGVKCVRRRVRRDRLRAGRQFRVAAQIDAAKDEPSTVLIDKCATATSLHRRHLTFFFLLIDLAQIWPKEFLLLYFYFNNPWF